MSVSEIQLSSPPLQRLTCFKAYDIRGRLGGEFNESVAYRIGRAYGEYLKPKRVVVGSDVRLTSEPLKIALTQGLMDSGVDVIDIGLSGTEEVYFAAFSLDVDGGIEITASHNPINYNGMKLVGKNAQPISSDSGLLDIQELAQRNNFKPILQRGSLSRQSILDNYVNCLLGFIDTKKLKTLKLVVNAGNGAAGHVIDAIEQDFRLNTIPIEFIKIHHQPDGTFPNGIPNPLLPENRSVTAETVIESGADMGIAWDGDFDRCFLFDETGKFIESYYIVGLLAEAFLKKRPGEKVIHDPRLIWNTIDVVKRNRGTPIQSKTGHAFIKERMRVENAIYGGEMSAHHYFRDFAYCDSGMIPWLLVAELISTTGRPLSCLIGDMEAAYPCSGEINYTVTDTCYVMERVEKHFSLDNLLIDRTDGLNMEYPEWRMNLRVSNTEPLLRLNVESRRDSELVKLKVLEIESIIQAGAST